MVPVCVGSLKYVRRGYITWAGDGIEYAAKELCSLLKYEFIFFRQCKIFAPFRTTSDTHFPYSVRCCTSSTTDNPVVYGRQCHSVEYSVYNSVSVRL
jgi:hypothetical protein